MAEKYFNRKIDNDLLKWENEDDRKPLLLRGARQVGKSSAVRKFAEHFDNFVEVNFEKNKKVRAFFDVYVPLFVCRIYKRLRREYALERNLQIFARKVAI